MSCQIFALWVITQDELNCSYRQIISLNHDRKIIHHDGIIMLKVCCHNLKNDVKKKVLNDLILITSLQT